MKIKEALLATSVLAFFCTPLFAGQDEVASQYDLSGTGYGQDINTFAHKYIQGASPYFENRVFDQQPEELYPARNYTSQTNDTQRLLAALRRASQEDSDGGVVILRAAKNGGNNRYRLDRVDMPSNVRLEVDPDVTIEMIGNLKTSGSNQFLFSIGRSPNVNNLIRERIRNVEITSTHPTRRFTIDAKTNMPISYGVHGDKTKDTAINYTRAIPIGIYYAENFAISGIRIIDNHTEHVGISLYPDCDYKDGALADRNGTNGNPQDDVWLGRDGQPLPMDSEGNYVDDKGRIIPDEEAIIRNLTYGRTPVKGTIENIVLQNSHTGYGAVQIFGGDWIYINNIKAVKGVGVRIEAGNGSATDNINRAGPYLSSINNVEVHNVTVTKGFTGVWLKAHGKINRNITVSNVTAIDSGTAVITDKSRMNPHSRDFINGRFENLTIKGNIKLIRTNKNAGKAVAEVGNMLTYFMSPAERDNLTDRNGDGRITQADLPHNRSGRRWYLMQPTSPMVIASQRNANEIGDTSSDIKAEEAGYYPVDFSSAVVTSENPLRPELILFNEDSRNLNGGNSNRL
ncbi:hypothetical protein OQJ59_12535 [Microbulbifer thermotolerans]|uniref:Right handed beta helix region n=1 Tax=Microbulbifer thermotolerans TaxID=252514 RepID=A0AB35HZE8_MICTH|nr:hypothetical protein [Microbulbifer thermotolerans]MCX2794826.1 hypothetical protein [Microbulbifer thermotolerans]MCX2802947.1 hypothetical protein [Microbulbifer thermotolerans]MCX2834659.1 hypothetical protein [Microbulbifer thermotolerans]MCX2842448.1 hypothetical protein [Microbulbifer thermotolerans]